MRRLFKWFLGGVAGLAVLAIVLAGAGYLVMQRGISSASGEARLTGLSAPVSIVRDENAVPHITAANFDDAVRALGFVQAQDRLWQMEVLRMAGQGRLSEMFGEPTVSSDIFLKTLDMGGHAKRSVENLPERTRNTLQAYADGVNAWINRDGRMLAPKLPPEFLILGHTPEPWEAWHVGAVLKVMDLTLAKNMGFEIRRLALAAKGLSPREIDEIMPYGPRDNPPNLPDLRTLYGFGPQGKLVSVETDIKTASSKPFAWDIGVTASNNWAVAGSRTASGKPLLGNDPHLGFTAPSVFYLAHLQYLADGETVNLIGGTLPGTPLMLLGRNEHVAWGLTTTGLDSQDIYLEQINPADAGQYRTSDGWQEFQTKEVDILLSDGSKQSFTRRQTRHGPVLPMDYEDLGDILPTGHVAALKWASLMDNDTTLEAILDMVGAKTVQEFMAYQRKTLTPMQSIAVADVDGNIGVIAPSLVPVRKAENLVMGRAPVPGWIDTYEWQGFLPFEELPRLLNPSRGALTTANANWLPANYPHHITFDWAEHFRQARAEELILARNDKHDMESMRAAIADSYSPAMSRLRDLGLQQLPSGIGPQPGMMDALRDWDGRMERDRAEPLIMIAWFKNLHEVMFKDDLGSAYDRFARGRVTRILNILEAQRSRDWCDDQETSATETCGAMLEKALKLANDELVAAHGEDWQNWKWGDVHYAYGEHRPFAQVGPLANLFNITVPSSGGPYTLLRGQTDFSKEKPYASLHGSAYRAIYDLSDPENSLYIQSTGQSGHFMSDHYRSFAELWGDVGFIDMKSKIDGAKVEADRIWTLRPAR